SLFHFFAQVLDVVPGNHHLNAMDKLRLRLGIFADHLALFGEVDFNFQVFERHAIAEVAIQPVSLLDDSGTTTGIFAKEADHLAELLAARRFGRLHVDEFMHDLEFMRPGILAQQLQLRWNGITLAFLVFARNAGIDDGWFHVGLRIGNCFAQHALSESWCQSRFRIPRKNFLLYFSSSTHGPTHRARETCREGSRWLWHRGLLPLWSPAFPRLVAV